MKALGQQDRHQTLSDTMCAWSLAADASKTSRFLDTQMEELRRGVEVIQQCVDQAETRALDLVSELRETQRVKLPEMERELVQVSQELELLQVQFEVKETEINSARTQISVLNDTIVEMRTRMEKMQEHETSVGALQREMRSGQREHDQLRTELQSKEKELLALNSRLTDAHDKLAEAQHTAEVLEQQTKSDVEALARERAASEAQVQELRTTMHAQFAADAQAKEAELQALKTHLAILNEALEDTRYEQPPHMQEWRTVDGSVQSLEATPLEEQEVQRLQGKCIAFSQAISDGVSFALHDVKVLISELQSQVPAPSLPRA